MILPRPTLRNLSFFLVIIGAVTILPFLGLSDFHTKGEPREAVVALSMLDQNNWILPTNNGGEIPYKPPFFHWCIALASLLTGGHVTEFTSRLPSAIALIAMAVALFRFYARRQSLSIGFLASIITLSAFEIHRAGPNCRVDMMLTALMVGALLAFYGYYERGLKGIPWTAILLMSLATLTKGPVGSILPCLCFGVFLLLRGMNFFRAFLILAISGLASLLLPLCWYAAAYMQGGEEFLRLALEENFGRMTGSMSYDVHINPWYYNIITLTSGFLPWTLLLLISLFFLKKNTRTSPHHSPMHEQEIPSNSEYISPGMVSSIGIKIKRYFTSLRKSNGIKLYSTVNILVIFIFYCIPAGKRSVYLMPIYPFIAYFIACFCIHLVALQSKSLKIYGSILASLGLLITAVYLAIKFGQIPDSIFGHGRHAAQNIAIMHNLGNLPAPGRMIILCTTIISAGWFIWIYLRRTYSKSLLWAICILTFGLYMAIDGAFQPQIFATKSQRPIAAEINALAPERSGTLYEYIISAEEAAGDPIHFFEINFYLADRIHNFAKERPADGYLLITDEDAAIALPEFKSEGYEFEHIYTSSRPGLFHRPVQMYHFTKTPSHKIC